MNNLSRYNIINRNTEDTFIFNSLSGAFIKISTKIYDSILSNNSNSHFDIKEILKSEGIISSDKEDLYLYRLQSNNLIYCDKGITIYIAPTMDCNFSCFYCFEGKEKRKDTMPVEVEDSIVNFIEKNSDQEIFIIWFGGEPLLGFRQILSIAQKLKNKNIQFKSSMITNGSLLTKSKRTHLKELNLTNIQISLDGMIKTHNSRRFFKHTKKGSFNVIIENIRNLLRTTSIPITIQVAIDQTNNSSYSDVLQYFNDEFPTEMDNKKLRIGYNIIQDRTSFDTKSICNTSFDNFQNIVDLLNLDKKNKHTPVLPNKAYPCMYRSTNCFAIDDKGDIFKCIEHLGNPDKRIGNVVSGHLSLKKLAASIFEKDPFEDLECIECNVFPICGGGCPIDNIEKNRKACSFLKTELENLLPHFYKSYEL